ncbi:MAG: AGE family epimerase/isomerase [Acidobacteria bacterium]|nr:AGE family epimerase/isomerase [Acidobacteriota bacterium]MBU2437776.1 AGE family epimerase/isomerase [Acidobacteriota bacterium]
MLQREKKLKKILIVSCGLLLVLTGCPNAKQVGERLMDGEFWRNQLLFDLMPHWLEHVTDKEYGAFYMNLSREWKPMPPWDKVPAMISRQIFSFSTAYLLSGEEKYLEVAREAVDYLLEYGWDKKYGGWFGSLTQDGAPKDTVKGAASQLYSNVGLIRYYFVTGDEQALSHVLKSVEIQKTYAQDKEFDGYYVTLNRDLSVRDFVKAKHSHYGQGSIMPDLILATRDPEVLAFAEHLADLSIERMIDPEEGWILGYPIGFDQEWNHTPYIVEGKEGTYLGASSTAALFFLRLYHLTGKEIYLKHGMALGEKLCRYGWDTERGGWYSIVEKSPPYQPLGVQEIYWWIQIYGSLLQLQMYHVTQEDQYLNRFRKSELFYDRYFVDQKYGGVFKSVSPDGLLLGDGNKAEVWLTSYHQIEHAWLNYIYLNLYVNKRPVVLHFKLDGPKKYFVSPVDDPSVHIQEVRINGKLWDAFDAKERSIDLPDGKSLKVEVTLVGRS